ncbi:invasion associated locus B family protein [Limobrevibacterium gyesilva]|uniref:Invasion associated locus B family protein n=1 Tax=Limobrevibacterium gyesilva TaxID=2991712 RepID=A0AA41YQG6_9PROT|nr:invasion associated locus B family protein [Limobrevibacterium gyesilva]MCW3476985.1 invasion associated locus B family protein [Limobrevibacterium gyesilva]
MRAIPVAWLAVPVLGALALAGPPALAQKPAKPAAHPAHTQASPPKAIGKYDDWQAATHVEGGQTVCYAFTRAQSSAPDLSGRGDVVLTVTQRPTLRDAVAISAGFTYAANAAVDVQIDQTNLEFYTAQRSAFARDGRSVVVGMQKAAKVVARSPGPRNAQVADTFSLRGFTAAYSAINKACPPK